MYRFYSLALAAALAFAPFAARADESPQQIFGSLKQQKGEIQLGSNLAHLSLTDHFAYLDPADSETFLVKLWGNPPGAAKDSLGMIIPTDGGRPTYAIVIQYEDSGNVPDSDAAGIDYDQLLKDMQQSTRDDNEERKKQNYATVELLGWAKPPYYDAQAKKLYWAKRLKFSDDSDETLRSACSGAAAFSTSTSSAAWTSSPRSTAASTRSWRWSRSTPATPTPSSSPASTRRPNTGSAA